ncbi:MAG: hypothetical protein AAFN44_01035 [Pseudomonadota bacterium]
MEVAGALYALPMQRVMGHIPRAAEPRDALGFRGRLVPQTVVHGDGRDLWSVCGAPIAKEGEQGEGVTASRYGDSDVIGCFFGEETAQSGV